MTTKLSPPKKCIAPGCGTTAEHPDSLVYLFQDQGITHDECRWCRTQKEMEQRQAKAIGMSGKVYLALDLKIMNVDKPKFHQLSRDTKRCIREKEYKDFPPAQIYVSDGYSIWRLSDFRYRTSSLRELAMDWDEFNAKHETWSMIEFD